MFDLGLEMAGWGGGMQEDTCQRRLLKHIFKTNFLAKTLIRGEDMYVLTTA